MNAVTSCVDNQSTFCISVAPTTNSGQYLATVQSIATGWAGIAFNTTTMSSGTTAYVGWTNTTGFPVISQRKLGATVLPPFMGSVAVQSPIDFGNHTQFPLQFSFLLPIDISTIGRLACVFAISPTKPAIVDSPDSDFTKHSVAGSFTLDGLAIRTIVNSISPIPPASRILSVALTDNGGDGGINLVLLHGIFMFISWGVLFPLGVFIAQYLKVRLGHPRWLLLHKLTMLLGVGGLMTLALVFVELQNTSKTRFIGSGVHGIIGTVIAFAIYPAQVFMGFICSSRKNAIRSTVPRWDRLHWWVGRICAILVIVNIFLGLLQFGASLTTLVLYWIWIALILTGFIVLGYYRVGGLVRESTPTILIIPDTVGAANRGQRFRPLQRFSWQEGQSTVVSTRAPSTVSLAGAPPRVKVPVKDFGKPLVDVDEIFTRTESALSNHKPSPFLYDR